MLRRRILLRAAAILLGLVGGALTCELTLRFLPVDLPPRTRSVNARSPVVRHQPAQQLRHTRGWRFELTQEYTTNNYGFVNDQDYDPRLQTPLVAVIGDSYVEARMLPFSDSMTGRLRTELEPRARVYSFAVSGAPLSQYLAFAEFAKEQFAPDYLVVVVISNDFDESVLEFKNAPGFHYFDFVRQGAQETATAQLVRLDYRPSLFRAALRSSATARHLLANSRAVYGLFNQLRGQTRPSRAEVDERRLNLSRRAATTFLERIEAASGVPRRNILFLLDPPRPRATGDSSTADEALEINPYFEAMRSFYLRQCAQRGFEAIDLAPDFQAHRAKGHGPLSWVVDQHWNAAAHELASNAALRSEALAALMGSALPRPDP